MGILEKPLAKFSAFIQNNNFTSAIVRGITISIPVTIVGGLATLITAAPDPAILGKEISSTACLPYGKALHRGV